MSTVHEFDMVLCVLLILLLVHSGSVLSTKAASTNSPVGSAKVIAVWNNITVDMIGARSRRGSALLEDCVKLGPNQSEVDCFSIQQNFWIVNSRGEAIYWIQNVDQFAKLEPDSFSATHAFLVWNASDPFNPVYCDPSTTSEYDCRAPMYTAPVTLPRTFSFYSALVSTTENITLQIKSDFVSKTWVIPPTANCPCFIRPILNFPPPWGHYPLEFVLVGLDNGSTAYFKQGTKGTVGKSLVEYADGTWHEAVTRPYKCSLGIDCQTPSATGESSKNLQWSNVTGSFQWSEGAYDQGVYIQSINSTAVTHPITPSPPAVSYLYVRIGLSDMAFLTIYDQYGRATGYNASSGKIIVNIPHSFATLSGEQGVTIVDPEGTFSVALTPTGSGPYRLVISRTNSIGSAKTTIQVKGTILAWQPVSYSLDSRTMTLRSESAQSTYLIVGAALVVAVAAILAWRKYRPLNRSRA